MNRVIQFTILLITFGIKKLFLKIILNNPKLKRNLLKNNELQQCY
jgi:hypothetical protein